MKSRMSYEEWKKLEELLMKVRAGYDVVFDDHHGFGEMVIFVHTIGVMREGNNDGDLA